MKYVLAIIMALVISPALAQSDDNPDHTGEGMSLLNDYADCVGLKASEGLDTYQALDACLAEFAKRLDAAEVAPTLDDAKAAMRQGLADITADPAFQAEAKRMAEEMAKAMSR